MLMRRKGLAWAAMLVIVGASGCAGWGGEEWSEVSPDSQGYRWVGQGQPANFGSAYTFCRRTLRLQTEGVRTEGGSGILTTQPGGPALIPGRNQTMQGGGNEFTNRRQFEGCMEAQGWALSDMTQTAPSSAPASPTRTGSPVQQ